MPKFRKKPVVIEAEQWFPDCEVAGVRVHYAQGKYPIALCDTLEGAHMVSPGDWIITGVKGEKYPCKPDIFAMTYEPVESTDG
jgi:hypothetical protein